RGRCLDPGRGERPARPFAAPGRPRGSQRRGVAGAAAAEREAYAAVREDGGRGGVRPGDEPGAVPRSLPLLRQTLPRAGPAVADQPGCLFVPPAVLCCATVL